MHLFFGLRMIYFSTCANVLNEIKTWLPPTIAHTRVHSKNGHIYRIIDPLQIPLLHFSSLFHSYAQISIHLFHSISQSQSVCTHNRFYLACARSYILIHWWQEPNFEWHKRLVRRKEYGRPSRLFRALRILLFFSIFGSAGLTSFLLLFANV